jgi:hypothetical protein
MTPTVRNDRRPRNPAPPAAGGAPAIAMAYAERRLVARYAISPAMAAIIAPMVFALEARR